MLYDTVLLILIGWKADLLWLNYCFSNHRYHHTTGDEVLEKVLKKEEYTSVEKDKIIKNAMSILNIRYDLNIGDNYKERYHNLNFDE